MSAHINGFVTNLTGGLARLMCRKCREETIHRSMTCIHCKTAHLAYPVKNIAMLMRMGPDTRKAEGKRVAAIHRASVRRGARRGGIARSKRV